MSLKINYKFTDGVAKLFSQQGPQAVKTAIRGGLIRGAFRGQELAKENAPYKSGTLRRSILIQQDFGADVDMVHVGIDGELIPYAQIQEEGGIIKAKNKPYLTFKINGQWVRKKQVTIKPKYYMRRAYETLKGGDFEKIMDAEVNRMIQ